MLSIFRVQVLVFRASSHVPLHTGFFLNSASFTVSQAQPLISRNVQDLGIVHAFGCLGCRVESQEINQLGPSSLPMAIGTKQ